MTIADQQKIAKLEEEVKLLKAKLDVLWVEKELKDAAVKRTQAARKAKAEKGNAKAQ